MTTLRNRRDENIHYTVEFTGYTVAVNGDRKVTNKESYTSRIVAKSLHELRTKIAKSVRGTETRFKEGKGTVVTRAVIVDRTPYGAKGRPEHTVTAISQRFLNYKITGEEKYEPSNEKGALLPCETPGNRTHAPVRGHSNHWTGRR